MKLIKLYQRQKRRASVFACRYRAGANKYHTAVRIRRDIKTFESFLFRKLKNVLKNVREIEDAFWRDVLYNEKREAEF